jgi:hypothetical protein
VKNSLRAVNDRFEDSDDVPPPVRVIVAEGDEDVTIKVCGGCPFSLTLSHNIIIEMLPLLFSENLGTLAVNSTKRSLPEQFVWLVMQERLCNV